MYKLAKILKLLSDPTRLRILMLLSKKELCVCQIMGILGISQPLVSRNLNLLDGAGFLNERKDGKLVFYSLDDTMDPVKRRLLDILKEALRSDRILAIDLQSLDDCEKVLKKTGKCDMRTFSEFMKNRRKGVK